jgi:hypothetical protein
VTLEAAIGLVAVGAERKPQLGLLGEDTLPKDLTVGDVVHTEHAWATRDRPVLTEVGAAPSGHRHDRHVEGGTEGVDRGRGWRRWRGKCRQ